MSLAGVPTFATRCRGRAGIPLYTLPPGDPWQARCAHNCTQVLLWPLGLEWRRHASLEKVRDMARPPPPAYIYHLRPLRRPTRFVLRVCPRTRSWI